jgi:hypothetical protein
VGTWAIGSNCCCARRARSFALTRFRPDPWRAFERALERASIATAASIYVVDDQDAANIQFVLAALKLRPDIGITMALSNERLVPHLQQLHPNLIVVNPWETIAPEIVKGLKAPAATAAASPAALPIVRPPYRSWLRENRVLLTIAAAFLSLLAAATAFFHATEQLDWMTAAYFVVTMATTTGFGDISLRASSVSAKVGGACSRCSPRSRSCPSSSPCSSIASWRGEPRTCSAIAATGSTVMSSSAGWGASAITSSSGFAPKRIRCWWSRRTPTTGSCRQSASGAFR